MTNSTPIARTKTAALTRITDSIPKGYNRYISGSVAANKAERVIKKFHELHKIGATPAQRLLRKKKGKANSILSVFWLPDAEKVDWFLLFSDGELESHEQLKTVTEKSRPSWLGYELIRHANRGKTSWTWRRPKTEMEEQYALLTAFLNKKNYSAVKDTLARIAHQPGFAGVREQSKALCKFAQKSGYNDELPKLFYVEKVNHGERMIFS